MDSDIEHSFQAIFEVQEYHFQLLEEKHEEDMQWWMEKKWEERMSEWDLVALVVNVQLARMAGEKAVVYCKCQFSLSQYSALTSISRSQIGNGQ